MSKLLHDAAFRESCHGLKKWFISGNLAIWRVHVLAKVLFSCSWVPPEINSPFLWQMQRQMFLLVSGRHVAVHPDGLQHDLSIQISINLPDKTFLRVSCLRKCDLNLGEELWIFTFFPYLGCRLIYWKVLILYFDLFWMAWYWTPGSLLLKTYFCWIQIITDHHTWCPGG